MWVCLYSDDGTVETERLALPERVGGVWHGYVPGLRPGQRYGLWAAGAYPAPPRSSTIPAARPLCR